MKVSVLILIVVLSTTPLLAHHSLAGTYDLSRPITMSGLVTEVVLRNPHTSISLNVKGTDGSIGNWKVEMGSAVNLAKQGFGKETVTVSSSVTIQGFLARDGSMVAAGLKLTLSDGKQFDVRDTFGDFLPAK